MNIDKFGGILTLVYFKSCLVSYQALWLQTNRPVRLTQSCTHFKSPGVKILCVLYLHFNVAFTFDDMEIPETKLFIPRGFEVGTTLS